MRNRKLPEIAAILVTVIGLALALSLPFLYESSRVSEAAGSNPAITLTGVAELGVWTEEEVRAGDYWYGEPAPARPVLPVGETTLLRLKSADVVHSFYSPALGIGPLEVYPGHVVEVEVTPVREGVFPYYCTTVCGMPHFGMRGEIVVGNPGNWTDLSRQTDASSYWLEPPPPPDSRLAEKGEWLFRRKGCVTCHGSRGQGGVPNWNYVKETVPALDNLAEKLMLFYGEDIDAIVSLLEEGTAPDQLTDDPPIPRFNVFLAQYRSVRDVIRKGNPPGKKDPEGPEPPLEMLAWGQRLSEREIDAIIAYLLELQSPDAR